MNFLIILIILLLVIPVMLIAGLIAVIALAASPTVQQTAKRMLSATVPAALVGFGLAFLLGFVPVRTVHQNTQMARAEPMPPAHLAAPDVQPEGGPESPGKWTAESDNTSNTTPESAVHIETALHAGELEPSAPITKLPEWVSALPEIDPQADTERFVLSSERWSTVEEGEQELLELLRPRLAAYLERGGITVDLSKWTMEDLNRSHVRTASVVEQFELPVKSFVEKMHRVSWQISFRPLVRDSISQTYRVAVQRDRLWDVGIGAGLLTLLFGTWGAYFRIDDSTQGRYRGKLQLAATAASLAGLSGLLVV